MQKNIPLENVQPTVRNSRVWFYYYGRMRSTLEILTRHDRGSPESYKTIQDITRAMLERPDLVQIGSIKANTFTASNFWTRVFMDRCCLSYRLKTTRKLPRPIDGPNRAAFTEAIYSSMAAPYVSHSRLWNMDDNAVLFNPCPASIIDVLSGKSIAVRVPGNVKLHCTVALTISATGEVATICNFQGSIRRP